MPAHAAPLPMRLLEELRRHPRGQTINEICRDCDSGASATGRALMELERDGKASFQGGRWSPSHAPAWRDLRFGAAGRADRGR